MITKIKLTIPSESWSGEATNNPCPSCGAVVGIGVTYKRVHREHHIALYELAVALSKVGPY